ncbi:MAG: RimJ/RimL family protein N-acetyltransferase, partial [Burkholderiales bacterium]|nr:RimJ/RimL family protein N-acetyltransferase [Anaerolineae bacterium]
MFTFPIDDETTLNLFEDDHAAELFVLIDHNRAYLREWMAWLDGTQSAADMQSFIKLTQQQFADNNGFQVGIWYRDKLAGVIGFHAI